jgi:hypothetical protein
MSSRRDRSPFHTTPPQPARFQEALVYLRGCSAMLALSVRALLVLISGLAVAVVVFLIATA